MQDYKSLCNGYDLCHQGTQTHRETAYDWLYTVRHKKLHHFVFAITLSYLSLFEYLLVHIYRNIFETNWHQNHQSHLKGVFILLCEMQHTYTCYDHVGFPT